MTDMTPSQAEINEFCMAARDGDAPTILRLLARYETLIINGRDDNISACALTWAAYRGDIKMAALLLDHGADIDAKGTDDVTALGYAAMNKHAELVEFLLEEGARTDVQDNKGRSVLAVACDNNRHDMAELIEKWVENEKQQLRAAAEKEKAERAAQTEVESRLEKLRTMSLARPVLKKNPQKKPSGP